MKNALIPEAETVNAGTEFIIGDTTQQQVGEQTEKYFVKIEARQRYTLERKGLGVPVSEEERNKQAVKSFIQGSSSTSLSSFRPIIWFLFSHLAYPGILPWVRLHPSAKMDL